MLVSRLRTTKELKSTKCRTSSQKICITVFFTTAMGFHERMQVIEFNAFALIKWFKFEKERIVQ